MRVLIHGINYAPEFVGIGKYTSEMAEWLAGRGHDIRVHAARPYYPQWKVAEDYDPRADSEILNDVDIRRHAIYVPETPSGLARIRHHVSWLSHSHGPLLQSAKEFQPDIVFSIAPSLIGVPAALQAARRSGACSLLHVQDFEVGAAGASGLVKSRFALSVASKIERALLNRFDHVTTISKAMQQHLLEAGLPEDRTAISRNWADIDAITVRPTDQSSIRRDHGLGPDKTVLLYAGTISKKQGLELVIEAARALKERSDLVFLIYGEGPTKSQFQDMANGLGNVRFGPFLPAEKFGDLLSAADIHLLPQIEGAADLVLPSKLTGMLASGRPVIATALAGSGLSEEVKQCGVICEPGSVSSLVNAITALSANEARRVELGLKARQRAEHVWSKESILEELEVRLASWVQAKRSPNPALDAPQQDVNTARLRRRESRSNHDTSLGRTKS
jgi:colanic acid biosynthesis glycosyl transferase WcaI